MTHEQVISTLDKIHKNKYYTLEEDERIFLDDMSFFATFTNTKMSEKNIKKLKEIYRKAEAAL